MIFVRVCENENCFAERLKYDEKNIIKQHIKYKVCRKMSAKCLRKINTEYFEKQKRKPGNHK